MTMGGSHHHHQPLITAALYCTQKMVMPTVGSSMGPRPSTSRPMEASTAAETAITSDEAR